MRSLEAFEEDRDFVLKELEAGFVDHIEVVSRVVETEFFRTFLRRGEAHPGLSMAPRSDAPSERRAPRADASVLAPIGGRPRFAPSPSV